MLADANVKRLCVASANTELRRMVRRVPGVPVAFWDHGMVNLESVSGASVHAVRVRERASKREARIDVAQYLATVR
jgi:hypothetical protein